MSRIAFLFPGQGSQSVGMGRQWADALPAARAVFDRADAALGFPISRLCWEGPEDELRLTENTQPAILTASIAALAIAATTLISCIPLVNCLAPLVPLVVGIITLTKAKTAVDPSKARLYGWLATGLGIVFLLVIIGVVALYGTLIATFMNDPRFRDQLR